MSIEALVGKTILSFEGLEVGSEEIKIHTESGTLRMKHYQDCCESVSVEDICGYPQDLVNSVVHIAEERSNHSNRGGAMMWTFYTIRTNGGDVDIRWCGSSNGYYSISVNCWWEEKKVPEPKVEVPAESPIFEIVSPTETKPWGDGTRKTTLIRVYGHLFQISEIKGRTFMGYMDETCIFPVLPDGTRLNTQFDSARDTTAALLTMMSMGEEEFKEKMLEVKTKED
jgi:hypothetical protein